MDFDSRFGRLIWVMELNLIDMQPIEEDIRAFLIAEAFRFIERVATLEGISRIAMLGSILSSKPNPKDVDLLVTIDDTVDLIVLAKWARSLMGMAQSKSKGADVFLANQTVNILDEFANGAGADLVSVPGVMPEVAVYANIYMMISMT